MALYQNLVGQFVYKQPLLRSKFDQLGENDQYLKDNGWDTNTKLVFFQASVPTGWTLDTSSNDRFLRVVNNLLANPGGVNGGSNSVSAGLVLNHTHTFTTDPNHTHSGHQSHSHAFTTGANASSVGLSQGGRPVGIGNTVVSTFNESNVAGSTPVWSTSYNSATTDNSNSSIGGTHTHTVTSALGTINPAYVDVIIGIKSSNSGYTDLTNQFNHNDRIRYEPFGATGGLYGNDVFNNARLMPAGTISVFYNAAAPIGWNKLTSQNDKSLRVVSGTGGGGGGTVGTAQLISLNHTHPVSSNGSHNHTSGQHRHDVAIETSRTLISSPYYFYLAVDGSGDLRPTNNDGTVKNVLKGRSDLTGGGLTVSTQADHTHTLGQSVSNIVFAYIDVIQCQKLSTGAPYSYQDLTSTVQYKKLVSKQRLDKFAQNDEYIKYHTTPSGAVMVFYQSATPASWTLLSSQHDKVLRVVSGAGGASGGGHLISQEIILAHNHSIPAHVHNHSIPAHTHVFDSVSQAAGNFANFEESVVFPLPPAYLVNNVVGILNPSGLQKVIKNTSTSATSLTGDNSHNHTGQTTSALTNVVFNYSNIILCQKQ